MCLSLGMSGSPTIEGSVISISDYSFVLRQGIRSYRVNTSYNGGLDDKVLIQGNVSKENLTPRDASMRVVGVVDKAGVELTKEGKTLRSGLWKHFLEDDFLQAIVFNQYLEDFPMLSSLSMQLGGLLYLIRFVFRYRFKTRKIEILTILVYALIFGFSFGVIRLLLGRFKLSRDNQMLILLILFPGSALFLGFVFPYALDLVHGLSYRLRNIPRYFVYPILMSLVNYRINIMELVLFRVQQIVCAVLFIMAMLSILIEVKPAMLFISTNFMELLTMNHRLILLGRYNVFLVCVLLYLYYRGHIKVAYCLWIMGFVLCLYPPNWRVSFIDVNQGDATLIQAPFNAYSILIDTGHPNAKGKLLRALRRNGVSRIDTLIVTHDDLDHSGNIDEINYLSLVQDKGIEVPFLIKYLSDQQYDDSNANSLVFSFSTSRTSFIFMGDAGVDQEQDLIREHHDLKVDVLKLGHHGSRTSTSESFIASIEPDYAVISASSKAYGHPHVEVMYSLYRFRVNPLLTQDSGDIQFVSGFLFDYFRTDALGFGIIR